MFRNGFHSARSALFARGAARSRATAGRTAARAPSDGRHPFEDAILKIISDNNLNAKAAAIIVQSFEPTSLQHLRSHGLNTKLLHLIDAGGVNFDTGDIQYNEITRSRPYDWTIAAEPRFYDVMLTPAGLAEIKRMRRSSDHGVAARSAYLKEIGK